MIHALIVDDSRPNVEVLELLLDREGIAHTAILSPRQVSAALEGIPDISVIFLDLEFPHDSGFDIFAQLRSNPRLKRVPIVAYTVHQSEIDVVRQRGFNAFLGKPLDPHRFPDQLRRILAGEAVWEI